MSLTRRLFGQAAVGLAAAGPGIAKDVAANVGRTYPNKGTDAPLSDYMWQEKSAAVEVSEAEYTKVRMQEGKNLVENLRKEWEAFNKHKRPATLRDAHRHGFSISPQYKHYKALNHHVRMQMTLKDQLVYEEIHTKKRYTRLLKDAMHLAMFGKPRESGPRYSDLTESLIEEDDGENN